MKKRNALLLPLFVFGLFLTLGVQSASADLCTEYNKNYKCTDITTLTLTTGCVANKCLGANANNVNVKCCPIDAPVKGNGTLVQPTGSNNTAGPTDFVNPLRFETVEGFLGGIMSAIQQIIVVLALVFIMIGAVMILASAGNSGMVEKGKSAITMALVGLALGVAAPSLLKELAKIIGWGPECNVGDPSCEKITAALTLSQIAVNVLNFLLGTMGIIALIMLVIGAIMYLTSAGDEDRVKKGKDIFKYSLIGVLLAMASMVLVTQIARFFQ
ncbi:MAG: hypothetical protein US57_C0004G0041 [Candidatus Moranbacteria bacterium GW2011_GWC2_37_73]|nr:MAG: hypothetical protein UR95_C0002G0059 [Parcubacteria group bacterium GW2011_GWC1_36_108]KKQ01096.1 MAG: hypothetical protein US09_C0003G0096 [Candidatus Moranbacteria bacterium GW2011_GWD1_36_198]KKQ01336.1 MAG: hypothetical protein US10_C0016G0006 [Candidatus Moranbacteria bacterium GW2011_GWD2_36_198]KKQ40158.1 MAG: hypothetical protein US57_C0004G0041 [Candidatus Moranbacteria bacterium GW2011_GWC2_37_73]HAS00047.1 hypothetical protein [Candidatus Moranbacteria bacterium]